MASVDPIDISSSDNSASDSDLREIDNYRDESPVREITSTFNSRILPPWASTSTGKSTLIAKLYRSRSRSRSREHTGTSRSRIRSRDSVGARFAAGGRTRRLNNHISSSDDVQNRGGYSDGGEQSPRYSPSYRYEEEIENSFQSETAVVLSEPDVLDCPVCLEPLSPPVYQCEHGHLVCGWCPSCSMPIEYSRCRGIEKVLESAKARCRYWEHGCMVTISYGQKFRHEKSCEYAVCSCPLYGCNYVDISNFLYAHFSVQHSHSVKNFQINDPIIFFLHKDINRVFLQESHGSTLFVLNRKVEPLGSLINVVCIAPTSSDAKHTYKLTTRAGDRSICLRSDVEITQKCSTRSPEQHCLLITNDFADHHGRFKLQLSIQSMQN